MSNLKAPEDTKIMVIGDIMLDHYIIGSVDRISPEAPVPVVDVTTESYTLGGAGNVIRNLATIGAKVHCVGVVGHDSYAENVNEILDKYTVSRQIFVDSSRRTTRKTRVVTEDGTQLLRVDREDRHPFILNAEDSIEIPHDVDVIIVSDYDKGMISRDLIRHLKTAGKRIIVDPKPSHAKWYNGVFMMTPNRKEFDEMLHLPDVRYVLKTLGKDGMILINMETKKDHIIEGKEVQVFNVSGAGDTVIATMAICIAMGINDDYTKCAHIANEAAGLVVAKPGTATVTREEFNEIVAKYAI